MKSLLTIIILFNIPANAQIVLVTGRVTDARTKEPLAFANIYCKRAKTGDNTDSNGFFRFTVPLGNDTMIVSYMGYEKYVYEYRQAPVEPLEILLSEKVENFREVMITGYRDPGKHIAEMIVKNKQKNDIDRFEKETYKEYNKLIIELSNLNPKQGKGFFNHVSSVYSSVSKDSLISVAPLFMSEHFFLHYSGNEGGINQHIKTKIAQKDLGLLTDQISQKFDRFMITVNPYNSVLPILKTTFISPVSARGLSTYKYLIEDTVIENGKRIIRLRFSPQRKHENTFEGIVSVEQDNWGIQHIEMTTSPDVNINYVGQIKIMQDYEFIPVLPGVENNDSTWALKKNYSAVSLKNGFALLNLPFEDSGGKVVTIKSSSIFRGYIFNDTTLNAGNFMAKYSENPSSRIAGSLPEFKDSYRLEELNAGEKAIYLMADSLKHNKKFMRSTRITNLVATGFYDEGAVKIGTLTSVFSSNRIEGLRTRIGIWTTEKISKRFNFNAYFSYGQKDQRLKGGAGIKFVPFRAPYTKAELYYRKDYNSIVAEDDELDKDNFLTLAFRKNTPYLQEFTETFKLLQEYDLTHSLSAVVFGQYRNINPTFNYKYYNTKDLVHFSPGTTRTLHSISDAQVGIKLRFARNEKDLFLNYDKIRFGSAKPVFTFSYVYGFRPHKSALFNYHKFTFGIAQEVNLPPKGTLFYSLSAGKIIGIVPSLLMHIPNGNYSYVASKYAFNNMLPYEYASDRYLQINCIYNAGGLLFDKIPLLQKLKLRERVTANAYWGDVSNANRFYNQCYPIKSMKHTPYIETGIGISNILSVLYVDFIWRVTERNIKHHYSNFGVFIGSKISF